MVVTRKRRGDSLPPGISLSVAAIAGFCGGILALQVMPVCAGDGILRCQQLEVTGASAQSAIVLSVDQTGPKITLKGRDQGQSLTLQVLDSTPGPGGKPKSSVIQIRDLKSGKSQLRLVADSAAGSYAVFGETDTPGYVSLSADPCGSAPGSELCVGSPMENHFQCLSTPETIKVITGGADAAFRSGKLGTDRPYFYLENKIAGTKSNVVLADPK